MLDIAPGRVAFGPRTVDVLEYALSVMQDLDVPAGTKMEAFALMNGFVALLVRTETAMGGATTDSPPRSPLPRRHPWPTCSTACCPAC